MTLYLHIGTHKAGSTTIQRFLGKNRALPFGYAQVESFGLANAWRLPAAMGTNSAFEYWVKRHNILTISQFEENQLNIWDNARREIAQTNADKFVSSSEYIYTQSGHDKVALSALKDHLFDIFDDVVVIIYLRDQVSFIKSDYAQMVKGPAQSKQGFDQFIARLDGRRKLWDFAGALAAWAEVFGKSRLRVVCFHRDNFVNNSLLADFLHRLDIQASPERYVNEDRYASNKSPPYNQLQTIRLVNILQGLVPRAALKPLRRICLGNVVSKLGRKEFPTIYDALILEKVSEGNKWVNKNYLEHFPVKLPTTQ